MQQRVCISAWVYVCVYVKTGFNMQSDAWWKCTRLDFVGYFSSHLPICMHMCVRVYVINWFEVITTVSAAWRRMHAAWIFRTCRCVCKRMHTCVRVYCVYVCTIIISPHLLRHWLRLKSENWYAIGIYIITMVSATWRMMECTRLDLLYFSSHLAMSSCDTRRFDRSM